MSVTPSTMSPLGMEAPDFELPDTSGELVSLGEFDGANALLVVFLCNHCPYVKHIRDELAEFARDYRDEGLAVVGISSNDVEQYPEDAPDRMKEVKEEVGFPFPYLYDESQEVAREYGAACTPDFFLFDENRELVYRGQFDDSRPGNDVPVTGEDLRTAADRTLEGRPVPEDQSPSVGCNIKWKPGNEPDYAA
ncbi:MAG: thioredoxin family protein [Candidatus Palauibacterales bacterium]|nr:thioredoxin family protein [Candidatus Palauibacterales bacterium]